MSLKNIIGVLNAFHKGIYTAPEVASMTGMSVHGTYRILRCFERLGVIRQCGIVPAGRQRFKLYELSDMKPNLTIKSRLSPQVIGFVSIWRAMGEPVTYKQIAEITGYQHRQIQRITRTLHKKGLIHIASWDYGRFNPIPEYVRGPGPNAPRPKPMGTSEVNRRYKQASAAKKFQQIIFGLAA